MTDIIAWLAQTPLSQTLAGNAVAFPLLETIHVLAISLVLGLVTIFDMRLLGLGWQGWPTGPLLIALRRLTLVGFALAALSGGAMVLSQPQTYAHNLPFLVKLALLGAAGGNLLVFDQVYGRDATHWGTDVAIPLGARIQGVVSLGLWASVLVAGRFIGFVLPT